MCSRNKQQGVVLVIALLALVAISFAGIALMRTVDTSNVVSGNIAFNQTATQLADVGAERSYLEILGNLDINPSGCQNNAANCPTNSAGENYFYPNLSILDPVTKLPAPAGGLFWSDPFDVLLPGDTTASYQVKYTIERMCWNTTNMQEKATFSKCRATPLPGTTGALIPNTGKLFYRITVQVTGPKNTTALAQYFYGVQDAVFD